MQLEVFTKNIFLIWVGEMIFFDMVKIHDFCSKNDNSNSLQNTKKFSHHEKVQNVDFRMIQDFPLKLKETFFGGCIYS